MIKKIIVGLTILAISSLSSVASSTAKTHPRRHRRGHLGDVDIDDSFNHNKIAKSNLKIGGKVVATKGSNVAINNAATVGDYNDVDFDLD